MFAIWLCIPITIDSSSDTLIRGCAPNVEQVALAGIVVAHDSGTAAVRLDLVVLGVIVLSVIFCVAMLLLSAESVEAAVNVWAAGRASVADVNERRRFASKQSSYIEVMPPPPRSAECVGAGAPLKMLCCASNPMTPCCTSKSAQLAPEDSKPEVTES